MMKKTKKIFPGLLVACMALFSAVVANERATDDGMVHVIVGLNNAVSTTKEEQETAAAAALVSTKALAGPPKHSLTEFVQRYQGHVTAEYHREHAVALTLPKEQLAALEQDSHVLYLDGDDQLVYHQGEQSTSWADNMIGQLTANLPPASSTNQINNERCFKICFVDAGMLTSHPDIVS